MIVHISYWIHHIPRKPRSLEIWRKMSSNLPGKSTSSGKRHSRDVFHSYLVNGADLLGPLDMPVLKPTLSWPRKLVAFSDAMNKAWDDFDCTVHFFEDDFRIEPFWSNPRKYLPKLSKFDSVIGPDYSVCYDFPIPLKEWNAYRNQALSYWLQRSGVRVIPNVRCDPDKPDAYLAGIPKHSTIAIGARACIKRRRDRDSFVKSVDAAVLYLEPNNVVWYGSEAYGVADHVRSLGVDFRSYLSKGRGNLREHSNG